MVIHHLEYGNLIWRAFYAGDKKSVESVQRRATKLIPQLREKPYEERLQALDLPSLEYRRNRGDMIQCFKIFNGLVRMKVDDLFTLVPPAATRSSTFGHHLRILRGKVTSQTRINAFSQRVIKNWNDLPKNVVEATSLNDFKNKLDECWEHKKFVTSAA